MKVGIIFMFMSLIVLSGGFVLADFNSVFSVPSDEIPNEIIVDQEFRGYSEYDLNINQDIVSFSVDIEAVLIDKYSYARVVLVDVDGNELLVYQASFPFEDFNNLIGVCEETCVIDVTRVDKLIIETDEDSMLRLKKIKYLTAGKSFNIGATKTSKKLEQENFKINFYNTQKALTWKAGDTGVGDLSYSEKKDLFGGWFGTTCGFEYYTDGVFRFCEEEGSTETGFIGGENYTDLFDYRNWHGENWMTSVKNQASCGSCWAFSAVGTLEGVINTYYNQHLDVDLSEQDLVACSSAGDCSGGSVDYALDYIRDTGIVNETCFPYSYLTDDNCGDKCVNSNLWKITDRYLTVKNNREIDIKRDLTQYGPLSMTGPANVWNHAIVLTGYGYNSNGSYWILKNSWGETWGFDGGYGKIAITAKDLYQMTGFRYIETPISPATESYAVLCVDNDLDGFCNWGIDSRPTSGCPASCNGNDVVDCDDSNNTIGACDNETLYCGEFNLVYGGEEESFGTYYKGNELGCCGDDPNEFLINNTCCNLATDISNTTTCTSNLDIVLLTDLTYPATQELENILVYPVGKDVYFKAEATMYGYPKGYCDGCNYEWYVDDELQIVSGTEFSISFDIFGIHEVKVKVIDNQSQIDEKSVFIVNGVRNVTTEPNIQRAADIYKDIIVFQDNRNGNFDIYIYNLTSEFEQRITIEVNNQENPRIYKNIIVYEDDRLGRDYKDIYMYDLNDGRETQVTTDVNNQRFPDIYGDIIVWQDNRNTDWDIYFYNISDSRENYVTRNSGFNEQFPRVYGDIIVWQDNRNTDWDIYFYNISNSSENRIITNLDNQENPAIWGDIIVWQDNRNNLGINNWDIYMYNISSGGDVKLSNSLTMDIYPDIYGGIVTWQNNRNNNWDIYMTDIFGNIIGDGVGGGLIGEYKITLNNLSQSNPVVYGNVIVWDDGRGGNENIYMVELTKDFDVVDVNFDGQVNVIDLAIVVFNQGHTEQDYLHLDLDNSGTVDWADVLQVLLGI
ncbi:MAG: hypothetical protein KKF48_02500 [Nanoarchaeota archaeon]|nr:hypothetical protein [Nanoarchaeota archaeon]MBU1027891.1 hypothetical protein [Nanoarchaeota archaeon]